MFYHVPYAQDNIAAWYDAAPINGGPEAVRQWRMLAKETTQQVTRLLAKCPLEILRVTGQPYNNAEEMFDEIDSGSLQVSTDYSEHPVLSPDENFDFRVWHDLAHYEVWVWRNLDSVYDGFSYADEVHTYKKQLEHVAYHSILPYKDIRHALFVEVLGQAASMTVNGVFNTQKVF